VRTTQEHVIDSLADRLEDAEAEAGEWRRFALISLWLNFGLAAVATVGWLR